MLHTPADYKELVLSPPLEYFPITKKHNPTNNYSLLHILTTLTATQSLGGLNPHTN